MFTENMALTIGIPAYNARDDLHKLLTSIKEELGGRLDYEVIIIDDGSTDGTAEVIPDEFPWVCLIRNQQNLGLAKSTNNAIEASNAKYFMRLDADTWLKDDTLRLAIDFMNQNLDTGVVGPRLLNPDGSLQPSARLRWPTPRHVLGEFLILFSKMPPFPRLFDSVLIPEDKTACKVEHVIGAAIILRKEAIQLVGAMDPQITFFRDETDWQKRISDNGWDIWYLPEVNVYHRRGQSSSDLYIHAKRTNLRSLWRFNQKHFPRERYLFFVTILLGAILSLLLGLFFWPLSRFNQRMKLMVYRILRSYWEILHWHFHNYPP